jgi:hypothetical protein
VNRRFNAPQRPSQPPQRDHLLFLFLVQDIAHVDAGYPRVRINVLDQSLPLAGFQVIIIGRFWVITEVKHYPRKLWYFRKDLNLDHALIGRGSCRWTTEVDLVPEDGFEPSASSL